MSFDYYNQMNGTFLKARYRSTQPWLGTTIFIHVCDVLLMQAQRYADLATDYLLVLKKTKRRESGALSMRNSPVSMLGVYTHPLGRLAIGGRLALHGNTRNIGLGTHILERTGITIPALRRFLGGGGWRRSSFSFGRGGRGSLAGAGRQ
jgi:hypothetical protein